MTDLDREEFDPIEVWNGVLRDERRVEVNDATLVVTHRFTSTNDVRVQFLVVDPLPGQFDVDDIGFHPDYEPAHGRLGVDQAVISGVAKPDGAMVVKYAIKPRRRPDADEVADIQEAAKPSIEISTPFDEETSGEVDLETAAMTRSSAETEPGRDEPEALSQLQERIKAVEEAAAESAEVGVAEAEPSASVDPTDETDDDATAGGAFSGDPFGGSEDNASLASSIAQAQAADEDEEGSVDRQDRAGVVETLIGALEADRLSADQRQRLRQQFQDLLDQSEPSDRPLEVRLDHLESELQRFEAYSTALEAVIDAHGPAEEFLADVRGDIAALDDATVDLESAIDRESDARTSLREWVSMLADEVAGVNSRQERLLDRVESLQDAHRSRAAEFDTRLGDLEPLVEEYVELSAEVRDMRASVEELERRLAALRDALTRNDFD